MFENAFDLTPLQHFYDWSIPLYLLLTFAILWIGKTLNQALAGYSLRQQLTELDNKAVAVSFAGFLFSLCLIISGVLLSPSASSEVCPWWQDLLSTSVWSALGISLLLISRIINDRLIFPQFCNRKELVVDANVGLGAAQAGSYIATALIIRAVCGGYSEHTLGLEILLTAVWFLITQSLLVVFSHTYQKLSGFHLRNELEQDNPAAGVAFGGSLVAFAWMLSYFIELSDSLAALAIGALTSILLLSLIRFAIDRLLLPGSKLNDEICRDRNWGAALIETATTLGAAFILTGAIN